MVYQHTDSRVFERFSARFPVKFKHSREDYGSQVFLRDASARGARFSTSQKMFLHDSISLEVKLPDGNAPMVLNGRVVWTKTKETNQWDVGMEFHKVNLMSMQRLYRLVEKTDKE